MTCDFFKILVLVMTGLCFGCTAIQDAVIRGIHMDYGYQGEVFPRIMDSYERKMRTPPNPEKYTVPVAPDFLNEG